MRGPAIAEWSSTAWIPIAFTPSLDAAAVILPRLVFLTYNVITPIAEARASEERSAMDDVTAAVRGATIPLAFAATVAERAEKPALRWRSDDGYAEATWAEYGDRAARVAAGLRTLGVTSGDRVVLMMRNRPEFHDADIGTLLAGATPVSIYNSSSPDQIEYVAHHAAATVAIVEDAAFLERVLKARPRLPALRDVVVIDDPEGIGDGVLRYGELLGADADDLDTAAHRLGPDDLATIIYTSGTTGPPKGVMLSQANVCWTAESFRRCLPAPWTDRRLVSFLPMAHIAERMTTHYDHILFGSVVTPCPDPALLGSYLRDVRPHVVFGAPRCGRSSRLASPPRWPPMPTKRPRSSGRSTSGDASSSIGSASSASIPPWPTSGRGCTPRPWRRSSTSSASTRANWRSPARRRSRRRPCGSGCRWGSAFSEIYGLSETCGPHTWEPIAVRPGTVGPPMPGCEVRLADDGEVLLSGGNIFVGYLGDPERTTEVLDVEGWLHSGDIGVVDDAGFLRIVDRKKELIITAGGKNVSPANLEAALKGGRLIGQAMVVGDGRPYVAALLVLDTEVAPAWARAQGLDVDGVSLAELATHPAVRDELDSEVAAANAGFSSAEQVKRYAVLADEWLPDSAQLTPTMKLKRREVVRLYADEIETLYA